VLWDVAYEAEATALVGDEREVGEGVLEIMKPFTGDDGRFVVFHPSNVSVASDTFAAVMQPRHGWSDPWTG
jgi:hypothetical protein